MICKLDANVFQLEIWEKEKIDPAFYLLICWGIVVWLDRSYPYLIKERMGEGEGKGKK